MTRFRDDPLYKFAVALTFAAVAVIVFNLVRFLAH